MKYRIEGHHVEGAWINFGDDSIRTHYRVALIVAEEYYYSLLENRKDFTCRVYVKDNNIIVKHFDIRADVTIKVAE